MEHTDWIGLSTFVAAVAAAVVSVLAAMQSYRNNQKLAEVAKSVNGVIGKLVTAAHQTGRLEEVVRQGAVEEKRPAV